MNITNRIVTIESHCAGEPLRIITSGIPYLKGKTMLDKMLFMKNNYDEIRKITMLEPRGHRDMLGAVLTEPVKNTSNIGVFYIDPRGYAPMCGAGTLALIKAVSETGIVNVNEGINIISIDTPAGTIKSKAIVKDKRVIKTSFINVASFLYAKDLHINTSEYKNLRFDIAYGGNFFAMVNIDDLNIKYHKKNINVLSTLGMEILNRANKKFKVKHPLIDGITFLNDVMFYKNPDKKNDTYKSLVIFGEKTVDRSPCGTGTCARMAMLYEEGNLDIGQIFEHESIIGTKFTGKLLKKTKVESISAVIPELEGDSSITGFSDFVLEENDTLKCGFTV